MLSRLRAWWGDVVYVARGVMGADAYEVYLSHHRGAAHTHPPMSEREFWKATFDAQDRDPGARCC